MERKLTDFEKRVLQLLSPLVRLLARLRIHPYVLTISGLVVSATAFYLIINDLIFWAGIMIIIIGLCDALDGELARYTGKTSQYGALFDSTIDRYAEGFIYLGLVVYFWERSLLVVILIIIAIVGSLLVSYVRARAEGLGVECSGGLMQRKERLIILVLGTVLGSLKYTGNIFLGLAIAIIAVLSHVTVMQRVLHVRRQTHKIQK